MRTYSFELEPTATWLQRRCLWIAGGLGDGFLMITLVREKGYHWEQDVYGVEEVMPVLFGTRRFMLIRGTDQPVTQDARRSARRPANTWTRSIT